MVDLWGRRIDVEWLYPAQETADFGIKSRHMSATLGGT